MHTTKYQETVVQAFKDLVACLNQLGLHIYDELTGYPVQIDSGEHTFQANRDRVIYALKHFVPNRVLASQQTEAFPGAVGGDDKTFMLIQNVNQAKDALRRKAQNVIEAYKKDVAKENPTRFIRTILRDNGLGLLNLKQVYRHIRYVTYHPERIAWTKTKGCANRILTIEQAKTKLLAMGEGEHIQIQLAKLELLKPGTKLVKRRHIKPYHAANLTYYEKQEKKQQKINSSLPIFYRHDWHKASPTVCFSQKRSAHRQIRADKKVENIPFLSALCAYRYHTK